MIYFVFVVIWASRDGDIDSALMYFEMMQKEQTECTRWPEVYTAMIKVYAKNSKSTLLCCHLLASPHYLSPLYLFLAFAVPPSLFFSLLSPPSSPVLLFAPSLWFVLLTPPPATHHNCTEDLERSLFYFQKMKEAGFEPEIRSYVALLQGFGRAGHLDKVWVIWKAMKVSLSSSSLPVPHPPLSPSFLPLALFTFSSFLHSHPVILSMHGLVEKLPFRFSDREISMKWVKQLFSFFSFWCDASL